MIIDQLPLLSTDVQGTDEIPIERGTSTYKTTQAALVKSVADDVDRRGLPVGGSAGEILAKVDGTDYNTQWIDPPDPSGFVSYAEAQTLTAAQQNQARSNIGAKWETLWTNASPTSSFAAQTISLNLTYYQAVAVEFKTTNETDYRIAILYVGRQGVLERFAQSDNSTAIYYGRRTFTVSATNIQFSDGREGSSASKPITYNGVCVPTKIYGIR